MKPGGQTQSTTVDPQTQAYVNQLRQYALGAAGIGGNAGAGAPAGQPYRHALFGPGGLTGGNPQTQGLPPQTDFQMPGLPPEIAQAQNQFNQYAQGGNLGFSALTGNVGAAQQFLNPYLSQLDPFFAQQRAGAVQGANDLSTQMGAFGGDRSQIAALLAGQQADQNQAGFNVQAFNDAMQRAGFAANLGYGASARAAFLPQQYYGGQLGLLNQGIGPYGQTQTTKTSSDPFSQLLGLGVTGLSLASGLGWAPLAAGALSAGAGGGGSRQYPDSGW